MRCIEMCAERGFFVDGVEVRWDVRVLNLCGRGLQSIPQKLQRCRALERLYISRNQIAKLEHLPPGLRVLYINDNALLALEGLPPGLRELSVSRNRIAELGDLPPALETLYISGNRLRSLGSLPDSLRSLDVWGNPLKELPAELPAGLTYLCTELSLSAPEDSQGFFVGDAEVRWDAKAVDLSNMGLQSVPRELRRCTRLHTLRLSGNDIRTLENLPESLRNLYIRYNRIEKLQGLPPALEVLDADGNNIRTLEGLPDSLRILCVYHNSIRVLEGLPPALRVLDVGSNDIRTLENLPDFLQELYASNNQLARLDGLPPALRLLCAEDNPLECREVPRLPSLKHIFL